MKKICKFPDCSKKYKAMGYCDSHYVQLMKCQRDHTKLYPIGSYIKQSIYVGCNFVDVITGIKCDKPHTNKGYCSGHYQQLRKNNYDKSKLKSLGLHHLPKFCKYTNPNTGVKCDKNYYAKDLCHAHYTQLKKNNFDESKLRPLKYRILQNEVPEFCIFIDFNTGIKCNKPHSSRRYCSTHYVQLKNNNWDESKLTPIWDMDNRDRYYQSCIVLHF